jgi:hypothetical protein
MTSSSLPDFVSLAANFWNSTGIGQVASKKIEPIRPVDNRKDKREVFRFRNAGPDGVHVIAKRCQNHSKTRKEVAVYEQMLPQIPVATPLFYGSFQERDSNCLWLFIEDVNGMVYDPSNTVHRQLAGAWLATLHTYAADCTPISNVTEERPDFDLRCIRIARSVIMKWMSNPRLRKHDVKILQTILKRCKFLDSHREAMQELYNQLPLTLVHGDFRQDNMQVRRGPECIELVVFDWGYTRWETPLPDITKMLGYVVAPDVDAYCQIVQRRWPEMSPSMIQRLGFLNEVFVASESIRWEAEKLQYDWVESPMENLALYLDWLDEVILASPWMERSRAGPESRLPSPRRWRN